MRLDDGFHRRAAAAVAAMMRQPELRAAVSGGVEEFFGKYPGLERTRESEAFIASLIIERLSVEDQETQKVA